MLRHGYQSWSPTDVATFGTDVDPSSVAAQRVLPSRPPRRPAHRREPARAALGVGHRHRLTTALIACCVGFVGSGHHDGTLRLTHGVEGDTELHVEAFLGDLELAPRETFVARSGRLRDGYRAAPTCSTAGPTPSVVTRTRASTRRTKSAGAPGTTTSTTSPRTRCGPTSRSPTEYPFEVFQLDDGYQAHIGDWLNTNDKFPSGLPAVAAAIRDAGYRPGIWIAPFLVAPDAPVARRAPRLAGAVPLAARATCIRSWRGGTRAGAADATATCTRSTRRIPTVLDHLEHVARTLVEFGFTYLKLDFTFAPVGRRDVARRDR